ncbi:MAG: sigma-54-dependent transcriptional regulator [Planctomycetota bacterium]
MSTWKPKVLVCDDEEAQRRILCEILETAGHEADLAATAEEGTAKFRAAFEKDAPFELVFTDLKMPANTEGLELLRAVKEIDPQVEVVLMTAYSTVRSAVHAMKLGAFEYLPKPFDKERFLHVVSLASEKLELVHENRRLRQMVSSGDSIHPMIGRAAAMKELFRVVERVARTDTTCLIRGESGTGKELVARAIHAQGPRANKPFLAINCAAIPESLIESELFGHEKGVFTGATSVKMGRFEEVGHGTLFLDEIGSMKYDLQAKLLRVIQEREFSRVGSADLIPFRGRIVAATAQDLEALIAANEFREDLYFRLNVVPLEIPPLRERIEDIPALVDRFLRKCNERLQTRVVGVTPAVLEAFEAYSWPGNVRELENCIERMVVLGDSEWLGESLLPKAIRAGAHLRGAVNANGNGIAHAEGTRLSTLEPATTAGAGAAAAAGAGAFALPSQGVVLEDLEADLIRQALDRTGGRIEPAAQLLGVTYKTLQYRIKKYDLKDSQDARRGR